MNRATLLYLRDLGGICGAEYANRRRGAGKLCLLPPGHDGECSPDWPRVPLAPEERILRDVAKLKSERDRRQRHREHLRRRVAALEARRAWVEAYPLFRLEYRLRGLWRRLRRYWRFVYHRTVRRALGTWPPS